MKKSILKKIIVLILISITILSSFSTLNYANENINDANQKNPNSSTSQSISELNTNIEINSEAAILIESSTRKCFI